MENLPEKKEFFNALMRRDFKSFCIKVFNEVSPNATYLDNWHVDLICDKLLDIIEGKNTRLILNMPPRYMKSIICSVALPAFILGHNPKASIIAVSYADELSVKLANDCRRVIESSWYQEVFPGTKLSKRVVTDLETTKGGGRYATSVNGTLTGRGADYIVIDDPLKPQDALSDVMRSKVNDWYCNTLYSRLNDKNNGKIILVMQRLHEDDLSGYLIENDPSFVVCRLRAIAEKNERYCLRDGVCFARKQGEPLHPERESLDRLLQIKETSGEYTFAGQYQQNPAPIDGGIIKKDWIHYYKPEELRLAIKKGEIKVKRLIQSWDTASKVEEYNDYSACVTLVQDQHKNYYILNVYRARLEFPDLIKAVKSKYTQLKEEYNHSVEILIEDKGSGISLIQELRRNHKIFSRKIKPEADKQTRLIAVSPLIENGSCKFPDNNPSWMLEFMQELLRFPQVKHDDQCDALSQALISKSGEFSVRVM